MNNEYSTYHNTMGRRSTLLPYTSTHMSKYSYPTDMSLSSTSHYGYTSWGLWRDSRNISPSIYSHKKRRNIKSFSILLMSAAFIVVLAVLAVAGLAFYFSTFKSDQNDSILVFDSTMAVTKGDVYTAALKNSQSLSFQQKATFYERLIRNALEQSGLTVSKVDILGFGDGPFITLTFRVFLDMRKIQVTINNVEEHMKHAFLNEVAVPKAEYKDIFISPESIIIKRLLDQEVLSSASIMHSLPSLDHKSNPKIIETGSDKSHNRKILDKPSRLSPFPSLKTSKATPKTTTMRPINEADIDIDSLPVIQGSFEITKTEADITHNNKDATKSVTSTLKPIMISPASIKITDNKSKPGPKVELITAKIEKTDRNGTVLPTKGTVMKVGTTSKPTPAFSALPPLPPNLPNLHDDLVSIEMLAKLDDIAPSIEFDAKPDLKDPSPFKKASTEKMIETTVEEATKSSSTSTSAQSSSEFSQNTSDIPKLDANLFTSPPVIDEEPWHPIHPSQQPASDVPTSTKSVSESTTTVPFTTKSSSSTPSFKDELLLFRNKMPTLDTVEQGYLDSSGALVYYKSFNNPGFTERTVEIEPLGRLDVKPYPLPVDKLSNDEYGLYPSGDPLSHINEPVAPKPIYDKISPVDSERFEYIGGGVAVKKPIEPIAVVVPPNLAGVNVNTKQTESLDILDSPKPSVNSTYLGENKLESRGGDSDIELVREKFSQGIKNLLNRNVSAGSTTASPNYEEVSLATSGSSSTAKVNIETTTRGNIYTQPWDDGIQLFPIGSKWEFVNGTRVTPFENIGMRKVYNETLQALVVENSQPMSANIDDTPVQKPNVSDNIQNISSIFDTIASKLGIKPEVSSKLPPFSSVNKIVKTTQPMSVTTNPTVTNSVESSTRAQPSSTNRASTVAVTPKTTITPKPTTPKPGLTTTTVAQKKKTTAHLASIVKVTQPPLIKKNSTKRTAPTTRYTTTTPVTQKRTTTTRLTTTTNRPTQNYKSADSSESFESVIGQAEVEVVDPNAYEDMLKQSQVASQATPSMTRTTPMTPLVTLLPAKSNSAIRNFSKEKLKHTSGIVQSMGTSSSELVSKKSINSRGPIFTDNMESVVKTSMNVEV